MLTLEDVKADQATKLGGLGSASQVVMIPFYIGYLTML